MGNEPGSFAENTVTVRLKEIARRVLAENTFPAETAALIQRLIDEMPFAPITPLDDVGAPDEAAWQEYVKPHLGKNWRDIPWYFAEAYFYRRLMAIVRYFQHLPGCEPDPYQAQKEQGLALTRSDTHALCHRIEEWRASGLAYEIAHAQEIGRGKNPGWVELLPRFLLIALWGNQSDLSLWPAGGEDQAGDTMPALPKGSQLFLDESSYLVRHLQISELPLSRVDVLLDNASFELVCDLALVDFLLWSGLAGTVTLHVKAHPTFVSDAVEKDVLATFQFLAEDSEPASAALGARLKFALHIGRIQIRPDLFWNSALCFWEMPDILHDWFKTSGLTISKGDANYRRFLGDRHWQYTDPFAAITSYFPAPLLALRVCKSEVICGLAQGKAEELFSQDPLWRTDGQWGMIQFRVN